MKKSGVRRSAPILPDLLFQPLPTFPMREIIGLVSAVKASRPGPFDSLLPFPFLPSTVLRYYVLGGLVVAFWMHQAATVCVVLP